MPTPATPVAAHGGAVTAGDPTARRRSTSMSDTSTFASTVATTPAAPPVANATEGDVITDEMARRHAKTLARPTVRKVVLRRPPTGSNAMPAFDSGEHIFLG